MNNNTQFDPYATLGVDPKATMDEIQAAYRRKAQENHPDRGGNPELMKDINMAWKILSDPAMKERYDSGKGVNLSPLEQRARAVILNYVQIVIRTTDVNQDMIHCIRQLMAEQYARMMNARENTKQDLIRLRKRLDRLKGPAGNFIADAMQSEIDKGEQMLKTIDEDEEMHLKAGEMLKEFSYQDIQTAGTTTSFATSSGFYFLGLGV